MRLPAPYCRRDKGRPGGGGSQRIPLSIPAEDEVSVSREIPRASSPAASPPSPQSGAALPGFRQVAAEARFAALDTAPQAAGLHPSTQQCKSDLHQAEASDLSSQPESTSQSLCWCFSSCGKASDSQCGIKLVRAVLHQQCLQHTLGRAEGVYATSAICGIGFWYFCSGTRNRKTGFTVSSNHSTQEVRRTGKSPRPCQECWQVVNPMNKLRLDPDKAEMFLNCICTAKLVAGNCTFEMFFH